jgi:hypothetical protein
MKGPAVKNVAFELLGDVCISVHGPTDPSDDEWVAHIAAIDRAAEGIGHRRTTLNHVIFSERGGPNLPNATPPTGPMGECQRLAVISNDSEVRRAVELLAAYGLPAIAVPADRARDAFAFVGTPADDVRRGLHLAQTLARELEQPIDSIPEPSEPPTIRSRKSQRPYAIPRAPEVHVCK